MVASSRVEELAAIDIQELDSSYNESDVPTTLNGVNFTFFRSTNVTVNPDDSRTIAVQVRVDDNVVPVQVDFTTRFATWE